MNHEQMKTILSDYLDDALPPMQMADIKKHVLQCGECSRFLSEWKHIQSRLFFDQGLAPREEFVDQVMARVEADPKVSSLPWWTPFFRPIIWAPAAVATVLGGFLVLSYHPQSATPDVLDDVENYETVVTSYDMMSISLADDDWHEPDSNELGTEIEGTFL